MLQYVPFVDKLLGRFVGDREKRDGYRADDNASVRAQFAAEFGHSKNWFDSLIDGLNRLPRPFIANGIVIMFLCAGFKPESFAIFADNVAMIPKEMWGIMMLVVTFYFGDRAVKGWIGKKSRRESAAPRNAIERSAEIARKRPKYND